MTVFEGRSQEIKNLIMSGNLDRSTKRIIDLANDFSESKDIVNTTIMIRSNFVDIRGDENKFGKSDEIVRRRNLIMSQMLSTIDEIEAEFNSRFPDKMTDNSENVFVRNRRIKKDIKPKERKCILKATNLHKKFRHFQLGPIDINLKAGQITGLVGKNGSGKSTLIKVLVHDIKQTEGMVEFPQLKSRKWIDIKRYLSYIPQEIRIIRKGVTLIDELTYWFAAHNVRGIENQSLVEEVLLRLDLQDYKEVNPSNLSGGYKLRLELAKIFGLKPSLIILDEPLANLDVNAQNIFLEDIRNLADSAKYSPSIIVSSQHLEQIESISDNILFLNEGKTLFNGEISNLGKNRTTNTFELETNISLDDLIEVLQNINSNILVERRNNIFLIKSPIEVLTNNIAERLILENIDIKYIRDISCSTKNIFESLTLK